MNSKWEVKIIGLKETVSIYVDYIDVERSVSQSYTNEKFYNRLRYEWCKKFPNAKIRLRRIV
jgi:hypothetical protein